MTGTHPVEREEVMAWLDGELAPERATTVSAHVATCAECTAFDADLRAVGDRMAVWNVEAAPADLVLNRRATPVVFPKRSFGRMTWRVAAVVGVAAAILLVIVVPREARKIPVASPAVSFEESRSRTQAMSVESAGQAGQGGQATRSTAPIEDRMIARTATLRLDTSEFDGVRAKLEQIVAAQNGQIASLSTTGEVSQRWLRVSIRVPVAQLDASLSRLRVLGKVQEESQATDDVTDGYRDLTIRIRNAQIEEQRLNELLRARTGTVKDVLEVEQHIARVRTDLERMESQALATRTRVAMATIAVQIREIEKSAFAPTGPEPLVTQMRNALARGTRESLENGRELLLETLTLAPIVAPWVLLLAIGAVILRRTLKKKMADRFRSATP